MRCAYPALQDDILADYERYDCIWLSKSCHFCSEDLGGFYLESSRTVFIQLEKLHARRLHRSPAPYHACAMRLMAPMSFTADEIGRLGACDEPAYLKITGIIASAGIKRRAYQRLESVTRCACLSIKLSKKAGAHLVGSSLQSELDIYADGERIVYLKA